MTGLLLIVCILSSGFTGNIFKKLSDKCNGLHETAATPSVWFACLGVLFAVLSLLGNEDVSAKLFLTAMPAGVCIFSAAYTLLLSMKKNALSISVIIVNLNFMIPIILSVLLLRESAGTLQLIGMLLSITVIVLLNMETKSDTGVGKTSILLPVSACICNGLFNFFIKLNEAEGGSTFLFFAVSYGSAAVISLAFGTALTVRSGGMRFPLGQLYLRKSIVPMLLIGVCNGVCFYTARLLAERMNAAAQFTIVTCASVLLSLLVGFLFQGDKFTKKSAISILFCILAVLCQYSGII
jgi:drug/metabolite transporter (DMT)-like permease